MDFRSVYKKLEEIFPQVDCRILKAAAIENSGDVVAAVESVLVDYLPLLPESLFPCSVSLNGDEGYGSSPVTTGSSRVSVEIEKMETGSGGGGTDSSSACFENAGDCIPAETESTMVKMEEGERGTVSGSVVDGSADAICVRRCDVSGSTVVDVSGKACSADVLDGLIEDAKIHKRNMVTGMESLVSLMNEVEAEERAAEVLKAEDLSDDVHVKAEELGKVACREKEANDVHEGEIYGEKTVLSTEARELVARLHIMSEEKDKSLMILDDIKKKLEEQLAAASDLRRNAEEKRETRERFARSSMAAQELVLHRIREETKRLEMEAEENARMREFLMERGQVVDALQGEISVVCQDVRRLRDSVYLRTGATPLHTRSSSSTSITMNEWELFDARC